MRSRTTAVAVILLTAALAACSSGGSGSGTPTITLYSGQHEQTTGALVAAFEAATGIKVKVRTDDEDVLANQIDAGRFALAGRRLLHREHAAARAPPGEGPARPGRPLDACRGARAVQLAGGQLGRRLGPRERDGLQHRQADRRPSCPTSIHGPRDAGWKGKLGIAPGETDFQPIVTSIAQAYGDAAPCMAAGHQGNAGQPRVRRQRVARAARSTAASRARADQPLLLVPASTTRSGRSNMHSAIAFFAPRDAGYLLDVSGAAC